MRVIALCLTLLTVPVSGMSLVPCVGSPSDPGMVVEGGNGHAQHNGTKESPGERGISHHPSGTVDDCPCEDDCAMNCIVSATSYASTPDPFSAAPRTPERPTSAWHYNAHVNPFDLPLYRPPISTS